MANILVVEDEGDLREVLAGHLVDEGHDVAEAGNGQEALELYSTFKPDLIISDINMPVMDGYEFLKTLQERHPEIEDTPFFFLTALADSASRIKGLDFGIDEYLCKPVDFDVLSAHIDLSLRRQKKLKDKIRHAVESATSASQPPGLRSKTHDGGVKTSDHGVGARRPEPARTNLLNSRRPELSPIQKRDILSANSLKNIHFASIVNKIGRKVNISRLFLKKHVCDGIYSEMCYTKLGVNFLSEFNQAFFDNVESFLDGHYHFKERAIVIPTFFYYIINPEIRKEYTSKIDEVEKKYSTAIISEILNTPDRLTNHIEILEDFSRRKNVQIIEIRNFQQIDDINLEALRIGAIAIDYNHAIEIQEPELKAYRNRLDEIGINFYIKEIPEGKIGHAQALGANLLSVSI